MIVYKPQSGESLVDAIERGIALAVNINGYVSIEFNDLTFGVNEKSNSKDTLKGVYQTLKHKYQKQGGDPSPMLSNNVYWLDTIDRNV